MASQDLARLVVRLEAQSAQLLTELEKANKKIDRFASQSSKTLNKWAGNLAGIFSARALVQFGADVIKAQGDLVDMAEIANTTVEDLSALGYAASQSGSDLETLNKGLANIGKNAAEAQKGSKQAADAFGVLGINVEDASGGLKDSSQLLLEVAEQFSQYQDGAAKAALAQELFGKQGLQLIPLLNKGADGIKELTQRAEELGLVVGTKASKEASRFNDKVNELGAVARSVFGKALADLVPFLSDFLEHLTKTAEGSGTLDTAVRVLATGFKLLVSAGLVVGEVFDRVGEAIGAQAATIAKVLQLDFKGALKIQTDYWSQSYDSAAQTAAAIAKVWDTSAKAIATTAKDADDKVKKTLIFGGKSDRVQEVKIGLDKIDLSPMEKLTDEWNNLTKTASENAQAQFYAQKAALDALSLPAETYAARLAEINKQLEDGIGITQRQAEAEARQKAVMSEGQQVYEQTRTAAEKLAMEETRLQNLRLQGAIDQDTYNRAVAQAKEAYEKASDGAEAFFDEAKRNAQDILGQGIYDSIKGGFKKGAAEALDIFADMLLKMATNQLAAKIFGLFNGQNSSTSDSTGGWVNAAVGAIGSFFGGGRAMTGPVNPGVSYDVNEHGNVERFVPDQPGRVEDMRRTGGGPRVTQYFMLDAPKGSVSRGTQMQIGAQAAKGLQQANRRNN